MGTFGWTPDNLEPPSTHGPSGQVQVAPSFLLKGRSLPVLNTMAKTSGRTPNIPCGWPFKAFYTMRVHNYQKVLENYYGMGWKAQEGR